MDRKLILTLIAMGIGILVVTIDITAINVALPAIDKAFDISLVMTSLWILD